MKKLIGVLTLLCLILGASSAFAAVLFSDDFSVPPHAYFDPDSAHWTPKQQPGWDPGPLWGVTDTQRFQSDGAGSTGVAHHWAVVNGLTVSDYVMEADVYVNATMNGYGGFIIRGQQVYPGWSPEGWDGASFNMVNIQGAPYGGRIAFSHFEFIPGGASIYDLPYLDSDHLAQSADANAYTHLKLTAVGNILTAVATSYDGSGVQVGTATKVVNSLTDLPNAAGGTWASGWAGLSQFGPQSFDNVVISDVPEPGSMMALMTGLGFAVAAFRKRRA